MRVITISRQMGSLGDELVLQLAQQLDWRWVGRDVIHEAALAAGVPQVALADIDELGFLDLRPSGKEWRVYQKEVRRIICELADEGNMIIVGRGGQVILHNRPDVLHVRVIAPLKIRIARLMRMEHISKKAARARLKASRKTRARYFKKGYGVKLNDPLLYHLVINTGFLELSEAVNLVVKASRANEPAN
jgi:cytidylate kinase